MDITWYGHSCFRIVERGKAAVVTDPFDESIGYNRLNLKADIVTISHETPGHNHVDAVRDWQFAISRPGEYEIGGVMVLGTAMVNKKAENPRYNVVYMLDFGAINVVHLGDLDHVPNQSSLDKLGEAHVLMIPVGGGGALSASQAAEVVALMEPNIVVPMHYLTDDSRLDLAPIDKFLSEMGVTNPEETDVLKVSSSSLPEQPQVALLDYKK